MKEETDGESRECCVLFKGKQHKQSISGMMKVIDEIGPPDSGTFCNYRNEIVAW